MPASWQDMCLLQDVKNWIFGNPADNNWPVQSDAFLSFEITAASRGIMRYLTRSTLLARQINEVRSGVGGASLMLREWPVLGDITSLNINGISVNKRGPLAGPNIGTPGGWVIQNPWDGVDAGTPAILISTAVPFYEGGANIAITYNAGYAVQAEPAAVPAATAFTVVPQQPFGRFAQNFLVTYANGTPMTPVISNPGVGQYIPPPLPPSSSVTSDSYVPKYTFSSADANAGVLLTYSFTPAEVQQCAAKWVGEWWAYKSRPGERSKSGPAGGGSSSYDLTDMPQDIKMMLLPYQSVVPIFK